ncbi:endolytic transglycosylase MltG [Rhizomonospora bruguierae]|uniref:endolytic transglycosylase MltG n=1 Tax=Rhizomonospora bruguierae TaxID=1581705 RepID=UPI001BCB806F|nr:endolytic transglycosylase MltG [Micromonospora sp. NBRC 107566]
MTIEELDLAFEETGEKGRHRRRRRSGKKRGRGRSVMALFMALVLLGALGGGVWYGFDRIRGFFVAPDYTTAGSGQVTIEVKNADTATDIGNTLVKADVVKSAGAFIKAAQGNPLSKNIQPGFYQLRHQMRAADALTALLDLKNKIVSKVTIPEGATYKEVYAALSKATKIPVAEFEKAGKDPIGLGVPEWWFNRTDKKPANKTIEGFLFPKTYEFPPGTTAESALKTIVEQFNTEMADLDFVNVVQTQRRISPYEALIAASIAQAEALKDEDMGPVVRVLYNRAYTGKFPCSCLGLDSTVNYWLKITGKGGKASEHLSKSELHNPKNPYNTHDVGGMPVGPIGNPGVAALKGAMNPPQTDYYYFVSIDTKGTMAYAKDYAGHKANIRKACDNGIPLC